MSTATISPLARDPEAVALFQDRVARGDWPRARRLGYVLGLHRTVPQKLFERDDVYLRRLARRLARRGRGNRTATSYPAR
ncbi:MAG: hypothetical protein NVS4B13_04580 [Candidatus Elarobacter sp.]